MQVSFLELSFSRYFPQVFLRFVVLLAKKKLTSTEPQSNILCILRMLRDTLRFQCCVPDKLHVIGRSMHSNWQIRNTHYSGRVSATSAAGRVRQTPVHLNGGLDITNLGTQPSVALLLRYLAPCALSFCPPFTMRLESCKVCNNFQRKERKYSIRQHRLSFDCTSSELQESSASCPYYLLVLKGMQEFQPEIGDLASIARIYAVWAIR